MQVNKIIDKTLVSPRENVQWKPDPCEGSYYLAVRRAADKALAEYGDWNWLNDELTGEKLTAREGLEWAERLSAVLKKKGFKEGDYVQFLAGNSNMFIPASFAVFILGGVVSAGNIYLLPHLLVKQILESESKFLICTPTYAELAKKVYQLLPNKDACQFFCMGSDPDIPNLLEEAEKIELSECPEPVKIKDTGKTPAFIFWSSGTTGAPKGIMHSHRSFFNAPGFCSTMFLPRIKYQTSLCFFHTTAFGTAITHLMSGTSLHHLYGASFTTEKYLESVKKNKPIQMSMGSHTYVQLAESKILQEASEDDLASVKLLYAAASAVPSTCEPIMKSKFKNLQMVLNVYGQTENGTLTASTTTDNLGEVLPGTTIKICDPDTGERLGPNKTGEIRVKSEHNMMLGYLKRPKETADYFDKEGFGQTGDLGYYDENGKLFFVDRLKELIKYNICHIAPTELEDILQKHPSVRESLVFGRPCQATGQELVTAVIVLNPGYQTNEEELKKFVDDKVEDFKKIRGGIIFRDELPRNCIGKLCRKEMRDWAMTQFNGIDTLVK